MKPANNSSFTIMLVDDEKEILYGFEIMFKMAGFQNVISVSDSRLAMQIIDERNISVLILDLYMPNVSGIDILQQIQLRHPQIAVIVITAANLIETAVECMKLGALDFFVKPVEESRLLASVARAREVHELRSEVTVLKNNLLSNGVKHGDVFAGIVTGSDKMKRIFQYVEAISCTEQPVLVTGETGVGKELMGAAIHKVSGRPGKFVAVNVAGLDDQMFSDTLFGHTKGAFTGAHQKRDGLITTATDGSLFLDEIGDLSLQSQVKLLRLIQDHEYFPLGSDIPKRANVRVIVATNKDLQQMIADNTFRQDLYYRFSAHHIHIPPLRKRPNDIPILVNHFLAESAKKLDKTTPTPPEELFAYLNNYDFPGNIRQLQSMVFDAVACHRKGMLSIQSFLEVMNSTGGIVAPVVPKTENSQEIINQITGRPFTLREAEEYLIKQALKLSEGNQSIAASFLGLSRQALNKKLTRHKELRCPVNSGHSHLRRPPPVY